MNETPETPETPETITDDQPILDAGFPESREEPETETTGDTPPTSEKIPDGPINSTLTHDGAKLLTRLAGHVLDLHYLLKNPTTNLANEFNQQFGYSLGMLLGTAQAFIHTLPVFSETTYRDTSSVEFTQLDDCLLGAARNLIEIVATNGANGTREGEVQRMQFVEDLGNRLQGVLKGAIGRMGRNVSIADICTAGAPGYLSVFPNRPTDAPPVALQFDDAFIKLLTDTGASDESILVLPESKDDPALPESEPAAEATPAVEDTPV